MKVLVTGAAGMLGRKFCQELVAKGVIASRKVESLTMVDIVDSPPMESPFATRSVACDLGAPGVAEQVIADRPDIVLHAAAVVSGEAEAEFDKGYRINVDGTRYLFEAIRKANYLPRVVFTSSIAVFGAPFPETIGDEFFSTPLTSYGTQKAIGELLLAASNAMKVDRNWPVSGSCTPTSGTPPAAAPVTRPAGPRATWMPPENKSAGVSRASRRWHCGRTKRCRRTAGVRRGANQRLGQLDRVADMMTPG